MRLWMVLLVTVVLGVGLHSAFAAMPAVGSAAPDFTLPSQDGTQVSLKDFRGKVGGALFLSQGRDARMHHRGAQLSARSAAVRATQRGGGRSQRGHDRLAQRVLLQGRPELQAAGRHRAQSGEAVRLHDELQGRGNRCAQHFHHRSAGQRSNAPTPAWIRTSTARKC